MGCQLAVCVPHKDMILIYNGDNQGNADAKAVIIDRFFDEIVSAAEDSPISANEKAEKELSDYCRELKLHVLDGIQFSETASRVSGRTYILGKNPLGISKVRFTFNGDTGVFEYVNAGGEKALPFGLCKNVFTKFPESYSDDVGAFVKDGHEYGAAVCAAWREENLLGISVQVIDDYFGRLYFAVRFLPDGRIALNVTKSAEDFFNGYAGYADGKEAL